MKTNFFMVLFIPLLMFVSCQKETTKTVATTDSTLIKKQEQTSKLLDSLQTVWNLKDSTNQKTIENLNSELGDVKNALAVKNGSVLVNKVVRDSANSDANVLYSAPVFRYFTYDSLGYLVTSKMYADTIVTFRYTHYFTDSTLVQIGIVYKNECSTNYDYYR